jgi:hypothetical protein
MAGNPVFMRVFIVLQFVIRWILTAFYGI